MANKYNLSHDTKYKVISSNYLSIENGGGTSCENCNKIITTTVLIESTEGVQYTVGADCALTLSGIGESDLKTVKETVKRCKKFYDGIKQNSEYLIIELKDAYALFKIVTKSYDGKPIKPFIHLPFIGIAKENFSNKYQHLVRTVDWVIEQHPEFESNYYVSRWKEEMENN